MVRCALGLPRIAYARCSRSWRSSPYGARGELTKLPWIETLSHEPSRYSCRCLDPTSRKMVHMRVLALQHQDDVQAATVSLCVGLIQFRRALTTYGTSSVGTGQW